MQAENALHFPLGGFSVNALRQDGPIKWLYSVCRLFSQNEMEFKFRNKYRVQNQKSPSGNTKYEQLEDLILAFFCIKSKHWLLLFDQNLNLTNSDRIDYILCTVFDRNWKIMDFIFDTNQQRSNFPLEFCKQNWAHCIILRARVF